MADEKPGGNLTRGTTTGPAAKATPECPSCVEARDACLRACMRLAEVEEEREEARAALKQAQEERDALNFALAALQEPHQCPQQARLRSSLSSAREALEGLMPLAEEWLADMKISKRESEQEGFYSSEMDETEENAKRAVAKARAALAQLSAELAAKPND